MAFNLQTLTISDYRCISGQVAIPLNAPVVLIHGTNGAGKSTVMSALELTLTGVVSDLEASDREHLVHRGALEAELGLHTRERDVGLRIEGPNVSGRPLLEAGDKDFFLERCFLRQRTLGQLLELYEQPAAGGDSPLTLFVKDLLGLDELDDLIDGLYPVTDKRRVKRLVPEYRELEAEIDQHSNALVGLRDELAQVQGEEAVSRSRLSELLATLGAPSDLSAGLEGAEAWLNREAEAEGAALVDLRDAQRKLESLKERSDELAEREGSADLQALEERAAAVSAALDAWRSSYGAEYEDLLDMVRSMLPGVPAAAGAADPSSVLASVLEQVRVELERQAAALADDEAARTQVQRLDETIAAAAQRLQSIDAQLGATAPATAAEELGRALAALIPHVHTDDCPVCGRDYAEVSPEPLSARLAALVSRLASESERLQQLANARLEGASDLRRAESERKVAARQVLNPERRTEAQVRIKDLSDVQQRLVDLGPGVSEGGVLIAENTKMRRDLALARERDSALADLRLAIEALGHSLGRSAPDRATSGERVLATLADYAASRVATYQERSAQRAKALEAVGETSRSIARQRRLRDDIANRERAAVECVLARTELENRRARIQELRKEAESARVRALRRVFTNSLNRAWRELFIRLAPEEPFVPSFRVPDRNERVAAVLETMHRDGKPGGSPAAMLSAGNLNTAALTLFLALNLSVQQRLPWILLDDPVQSMDEVHVAQFAALLRSLARDHSRRVLIAVHERALFEYLSLELSPADPKDALITVELARAPAGNTFVEVEFQSHVEDRALEVA